MGKRSRGGKGGKKNRGKKKSPTPTVSSITSLLAVGTRVEVTDQTHRKGFLHVCHPGCTCPYGQIIEHHTEHDGVSYSYKVQMACGNDAYIQHTDGHFKESHLRFKVGQRVECCIERSNGDTGWSPGVISDLWHQDENTRPSTLPYRIILDSSQYTYAVLDADFIIKASDLPPMELRFRIGDRVCFLVKQNEWRNGTVHDTWCNILDMHMKPYKVLIDCVENESHEDNLFYAPFDDDVFVRASGVPAPTCWICLDNDQDEDNLILRECACRGTDNGHVHMKCLVELARNKLPRSEAFYECITCKTGFEPGGMCRTALVRAYYELFGNSTIADKRFTAVLWMSNYFMLKGEYKDAGDILDEGIALLSAFSEQGIVDYNMYLTDLLVELSRVHQATSSLEEMGTVLDQASRLAEAIGNESDKDYVNARVNVKRRLAMYKHLIGDFGSALELMENAVTIAQGCDDFRKANFANLLMNCGNLNLECDNRTRGIKQISEGNEIRARIYGNDDRIVQNARNTLEEIRQGRIKKIPMDEDF